VRVVLQGYLPTALARQTRRRVPLASVVPLAAALNERNYETLRRPSGVLVSDFKLFGKGRRGSSP
jgi:hypothetical protein